MSGSALGLRLFEPLEQIGILEECLGSAFIARRIAHEGLFGLLVGEAVELVFRRNPNDRATGRPMRADCCAHRTLAAELGSVVGVGVWVGGQREAGRREQKNAADQSRKRHLLSPDSMAGSTCDRCRRASSRDHSIRIPANASSGNRTSRMTI